MARTLTYNAVKVDEAGRRYLDVSSDTAEAEGVSVLVPLLVVKGDPNSATSNAARARSAVTTPTASDLRDVLCAAEAVLLDSSTDETSRMNAGSSSSVRRSRIGSGISAAGTTIGGAGSDTSGRRSARVMVLLSVIAASFVLGLVIGRF